MNGQLAIVTGASSGIGLELAKCCARDGFDLIVAAIDPLDAAVAELRAAGAVNVEPLVVDLGTQAGVDALVAATGGRPVAALLANAGTGLGGAFLDQPLDAAKKIAEVNVVGTVALIHAIGQRMRAAGAGRILITGSIVGYMPGSFNAMYNASKAFLDNFSYALRNELKDSGVTVTCLMPGATDTDFFERAGMEDTTVGQAPKVGPEKPAADGYRAMMKGEAGVVSGFMNKVTTMFAGIIPETVLAEMHRTMAGPGRDRAA